MRHDPDSVCNGKRPHYSREEAQAHARAMRADPNQRGRFSVYGCPYCFLTRGRPVWHVGHTSTRQLRARARRRAHADPRAA